MMSKLVFEAIGTNWVIDLDTTGNGSSISLEKSILSEIEKFDKLFSRFRDDSLIMKIASISGKFLMPEIAVPLFDLYYDLYKITEGRFTPLIGQALSDAGYDKDYSLKPKKLKPVPLWNEVMAFDPPELIVKKPALLDFGAAGKGYLIDLIGAFLNSKKIKNYCIDAGGDILQKDEKNKILKVGMENPDNLKQVIGIVRLSNQSICASAGNRRKWGKYHHIIDPFKLSSPEKVKAVWCVADKCVTADALATCLFMVEPPVLLTHYKFEYTILYSDNSFVMSRVFPGELLVS